MKHSFLRYLYPLALMVAILSCQKDEGEEPNLDNTNTQEEVTLEPIFVDQFTVEEDSTIWEIQDIEATDHGSSNTISTSFYRLDINEDRAIDLVIQLSNSYDAVDGFSFSHHDTYVTVENEGLSFSVDTFTYDLIKCSSVIEKDYTVHLVNGSGGCGLPTTESITEHKRETLSMEVTGNVITSERHWGDKIDASYTLFSLRNSNDVQRIWWKGEPGESTYEDSITTFRTSYNTGGWSESRRKYAVFRMKLEDESYRYGWIRFNSGESYSRPEKLGVQRTNVFLKP